MGKGKKRKKANNVEQRAAHVAEYAPQPEADELSELDSVLAEAIGNIDLIAGMYREAYAGVDDDPMDDAEFTAALLLDLLHWCDARQVDIEVQSRTAMVAYRTELGDEPDDEAS